MKFLPVLIKGGPIEVCWIVVLDNFSYGSYGNFNLLMPWYRGILRTCGMRFLNNLHDIKSYPPSSPMFSEPFPVSN